MKKLLLISFLTMLIKVSHSQKAFEFLYYSGKDKIMNYQFYYANGYHEASKIKVINPRTKDVLALDFDVEKSNEETWIFTYNNKPGDLRRFKFSMKALPVFSECVPLNINGIYTVETEDNDVILTLNNAK